MAYPFVQSWFDNGPRKGPIKSFLVHMAEGGGTVKYLANAAYKRAHGDTNPQPPSRGVCVHYVIEYSGRIVQMLVEGHTSGSVNPTDIRLTNDPDGFYGVTTAKAVMGDWWRDPNSAVIAVEMEGFASAGPNAAEAFALEKLVNDVRTRFPEMGLLGHRDFTSRKACPGKRIDWPALGGHGPANQSATGGDVSINTRGLTLVSDHAINLPAGTTIYDQAAQGAAVLGKIGGTVPYYGVPSGGGFKAVRVDFGQGSLIGYTTTQATPYVVPLPPAGDCTAEVEAAVAADRAGAKIVWP